MLLHIHDAKAEDLHEKKKSNLGKYLALKVLATRVFEDSGGAVGDYGYEECDHLA